MIPVARRAAFSYLLRHPWQLGLSLLGICIGVAVIVAVDLANSSARKAFLLSMDAVTGEKLYTPGDDSDGAGFLDVVLAAGTYDLEFCPQFTDLLVAEERLGVAVAGTTFLGTLFFDPGSADLSEPARDVLDRLALALADGDFEVEVTGHTDDTPVAGDTFASNWELSAARAAAVARELVRGSRIDPARFTVSGRGMFAPLEPNTTPLGRARNRRVEVVVGLPEARP